MGTIVKATTIGEAIEALAEPLNTITFRFGFGKSDFDVPKFGDAVTAIGFLYYDEETETFRSRKMLYAKRIDDDIKFYSSHVSFPKQTILDITDFTVLNIECCRTLITINKELDDAFVKENTVTEYFGCNSLFDFDPTRTENTFGPSSNYILVDDSSSILLSEYEKLNLNTTERDRFHSFFINLVDNKEIKMDTILTSDTMAVCADVLYHNGFGKVKWITEMSNLKIVAFSIAPGYDYINPNSSKDTKIKIHGMLVERIDKK